MAERKKGTKPQSGAAASAPEQEQSVEAPAKRGAESASGKGSGSRQAKKAESKGRAQAEKKAESGKKAESTKKAPARKAGSTSTGAKTGAKASAKTKQSTAKSGGARATSKTADPEASEKATKAKAPARKAESKAKPATKTKTRAKDKGEAPSRPVVNARARFVRIAPRKARLVADQVRGMALDDALALLRFHPRTASRDIAKLLDSAAANAEANHDLVADELRISDIRVDEGPTLRRYRPRALGRATKINKRTSHIRVALTPED
jgi:large subunit ribosomal protein L22